MNETKNIYVQFKTDNPLQMQALEFLKNKQKHKKSTYAEIITTALLKYAEQLEQNERDPYFETRKKENEFIDYIISTLQTELKENLPAFMMSLIATFTVNTSGGTATNIGSVQPSEENINDEDIDWEFLEGF